MKPDLQSKFADLTWRKKFLSDELAAIQKELKQVAAELDECLRKKAGTK